MLINNDQHDIFIITERRFGSFNHRFLMIIGVGGFRNLLPIAQPNEPGLLSRLQTQQLLYDVAAAAKCNATSAYGSLRLGIARRRQLPRVEDVALEHVLTYLDWKPDSITITRSENHKDGFGDRFQELRRGWQTR